MVLWYLGLGAVAVWLVFRDPRVDFRLLAIGLLSPALIDAPWSEARYAHTLLAPVAVLFLVVALTAGRRPARPRLLMLPIGMLFHLVFDGMWTSPEIFWWPALGTDFPQRDLVPGATALVVREVVGLVAVAWFVRRFGLADGERRRRFARTGQVVPA